MASRRPLAALLALLALALGSGAGLAAFGRKAKLKLQRKAPEIAGVESPPRRSLTAKPEQSAEADLNEELEVLALQVLPDKEDQSKKAEIWNALQMICVDALGVGVEVWPFGSSANGCGEGGSDLDMVVSADEKPKRKAVNALMKIADECWMHGFELEDVRPNAKVPILMLRKDGIDIDLSCGNLLPLLNTRLLRSYTLLNPRLSVVAVAVKRWAKAHGLAKTFDGFISSYAWTLMVVYYMQIKDQLPSLHRLMEWSEKDYRILNDYAWSFVSVEDAKQMWHGDAHMNSAELLRGFFSFYATDFVWGSEVVSVRRGEREMLSSRGCYRNLRGRTGAAAQLHIEDPIDIRRNLNFALKKHALNVNTIRFEIDSAHQLLQEGRGLTLLGIQLPPEQPSPMPWRKRVQEGFLELPGDPAMSVSTRCIYCNTTMPLAKFLDHGKCQGQRLRPGELCCEMCLKCFLRADDLRQHQEATGHQGLVSRDEALALAAAAEEATTGSRRRRNLPRRAKPKKRGRSAGLTGFPIQR